MVLELGGSWSLEERFLERSFRSGEIFFCLTMISKPRGSKVESNILTSVSIVFSSACHEVMGPDAMIFVF